MKELDYRDIKEFFSNKGITIKEEKYNARKELNIIDEIKALYEFHKLSKGYIFTLNEVIPSFLGRRVENCLADTMKLKKFIDRENKKTDITSIEKEIIDISKIMINRCEEDIKNISKCEYRKLISRSIENMELCANKSHSLNMKYTDNVIYIESINQFNYNLIEEDYINLILEYKKKVSAIDYESALEYICSIENLENSSYRYIKAYVDFPYNFIKNFNRYRIKKKSWSNEEYRNKIIKSIEKDGISILK